MQGHSYDDFYSAIDIKDYEIKITSINQALIEIEQVEGFQNKSME